MSLILRVDVDKPFGWANLFTRVISKVKEDYWLPAIGFLGYGDTAMRFATYLHENSVTGTFFFRLCTVPTRHQLDEFIRQGHRIGLHADNTRNEQTFLDEVERLRKMLGIDRVECFSKHGSGVHKLGRFHYPPYEEAKYISWEKKYRIRFPFGNGMISEDDWTDGDFFRDMFWMHPEYRDVARYPVEWAVETARTRHVAVLVHPENFYAISSIKRDMDDLLRLSREAGVEWITGVDEQDSAM